jgi:hypothetical protein
MRTRIVRYLLTIALAIAGVGVPLAQAQQAPADAGAGFARGPMVRGTVTATAADHLTVKTDSDEVYQVAITPNTRLMKERQPIQISDVKVGDGVGAMGELDAPKKTLHALFVAVMDAEQVRKMREDLGKTYITGKVTSIDDLKLTILRPDHVSQVIEVDETTSFRKGRGRRRGNMNPEAAASPGAAGPAGPADTSGEIVTLADVKVGDMIAGRGSMKHGTFVPTTLAILPAGAAGAMGMRTGRRERQPPDGAPSSPQQ